MRKRKKKKKKERRKKKKIKEGEEEAEEDGGSSHLVLFVLAVVPAVTSLRHQQGDDVALGEAQQRAVIAGGVREDGLHAGAAVLLQARRHGAGPGQGPRLCSPQTKHRGVVTS